MIRYLRWAPAVAWMAVIFYWSHQPVLPIDGRPDTDQLHLVGHVVAYGILALLLLLGTGTTPRGLIAALAIATIYGALDEAHQSFVPGRQARLQDVALDAASAAAALASFTILRGLLVDSARPPGAPPGRGGRMGRFALALVAVAAIGGALLGYNLQVGSEGNESPGRANVQQAERVPAKQGERAAPARQVPNTPVRTSAKQAFLVDLAEPELLALVRPRTAEGTGELPVRNFDLKVTTEGVLLKGELTEGLPLPMTASLAPFVNAGKLDPGVQEVRVGLLRVPADRLLGPILRAFDVNEQLQASGEVMLRDVQLRDGAVRLVGLYGEGALVDGEVVLELRRQVASGQAVDGTDRPWMAAFAGTAISAHEGAANGWGGGMYVALGDSSALGQGLADPEQSFVSDFQRYLERRLGADVDVVNLARVGESSASMLNGGQMEQALDVIQQVQHGEDGRVHVVSLTVGASDVIGHLGSVDCRFNPLGDRCESRVDASVRSFSSSFQAIAERLGLALAPSMRVVVINVHNPLDLGFGTVAEETAARAVSRMNQAIAREAWARGWAVADAASAIGREGAVLTEVLEGDPYPNALGHQAIARAVVAAYGE